MNKADMETAKRLAISMETWKKKQWTAFNKDFAAHETITAQHAVNKEAYRAYMLNAGITSTQHTVADTNHYATLSPKRGQSYVDYPAMLEELEAMGIDTKALVERHTKRRADTNTFSFK